MKTKSSVVIIKLSDVMMIRSSTLVMIRVSNVVMIRCSNVGVIRVYSYVNVTRNALAWLGTRLLPCGHADVARDEPATCKRACGARDMFVCTWTHWPVDGHADVLTWSRCDCLPTSALISLQTDMLGSVWL